MRNRLCTTTLGVINVDVRRDILPSTCAKVNLHPKKDFFYAFDEF